MRREPIRRVRNALAPALSAFLLLSLAGCAVKRVPPVRTYTLAVETPGIRQAALPSPRFDELKVTVDARGRLAGTRNIYYLDADYRLQPYAYHRWYDTLATMLENKLLVALEEANAARNILDAAALRPAGTTLRVEVLKACIDVTDPDKPRARLLLMANLRNGKGETKTKMFEESVTAKSLSPEAGVHAFNDAANTIIEDIAKWLAVSN